MIDAPPLAERVGTDPRVLIVDDFEDIRVLLRTQLELTGRFNVVGEAGDGEEAIRLAGLVKPNVVLLDLAMPRMDGLQTLPLLREVLPDVRVIVLSAFDQGTMARRAMEAGADRYLEKGPGMRLAQVIDEVLAS